MLSVGRIESFLGVTGQTAYLELLEATCAGEVESLTGRRLGVAAAFSETFDIKGRRYGLSEPENPVAPQSFLLSQPATLASLTLYERSSPAVAWSTVDKTVVSGADTLQRFRLVGHRLFRELDNWPTGTATARADYSFGYAVDTAPAEFQAVVLDLIAFRYQPPETRSLGGRVRTVAARGVSLGVGGADGSGGGGMPPELLDRILSLRAAGALGGR